MVVNPRAGAGRAARVAAAAGPLLRASGIEPVVHICANGDQPAQFAAAARQAGADVIVAVGGDGLVAGVAEGLLDGVGNGSAPAPRPALAVVPTGSANDYARALGVRKLSLSDHVVLIADPQARATVDVMRVDAPTGVRHVLNIGGTGFDAVVAERATRIIRLRGAPRYVTAMLAELPRFRGAAFQLTLDGTPLETRAMLIAVANGTTYGGGMRVAPQAHLQNGWLDVCVIGEMSRFDFMRAFPSVFRGAHVSHPRVTMHRAHEVTIAADQRMAILGDGELIGELPATFRVMPRVLEVVVAPGATLA